MRPTYFHQSWNAEISIHECSKPMMREIEPVLGIDGATLGSVNAVVTMQNARLDLVNMGEDVEIEKSRLLETVSHYIL